tara:strand:- start:34 stop:324 length:291 start_codon:yes stop_codon:yes gene_type:complete
MGRWTCIVLRNIADLKAIALAHQYMSLQKPQALRRGLGLGGCGGRLKTIKSAFNVTSQRRLLPLKRDYLASLDEYISLNNAPYFWGRGYKCAGSPF